MNGQGQGCWGQQIQRAETQFGAHFAGSVFLQVVQKQALGNVAT